MKVTWYNTSNPSQMFEFLGHRATGRKLRLFASACGRSLDRLLFDDAGREAITAAERHADGYVGTDDLLTARRRAEEAAAVAWALWDGGVPQAHEAAAASARADPPDAAKAASEYTAAAVQAEAEGDPAGWRAGLRLQCDLLRELFQDPRAPASAIDPAWLGWNRGTVVAIAQTVYEAGRFEELPVLADALEEAGCGDAALLAHLRGPGPHARGCWALDLLLGRGESRA